MKCELIIRMYSPRFKSQNDGFLKNVIIVQEGVEVAGPLCDVVLCYLF